MNHLGEVILFVSCGPELELLLQEELSELGIVHTRAGYRGVFIDQWDWSMIYTINYASRLANRVLLPIKRFKCFDKKSLYRHVSEIDWAPYFKKKMTFAIDANVNHRELRNSLFAAQVCKDAICDQLRQQEGWRPSVDVAEPDLQLNLYIQQNVAVLSFDTSGAPLNKRGYRQESVEAPMQETLAAAILRLARYTSESVLLDPCCGSGTLLTEAALISTQTPPGYLRQRWGFANHPDHRPEEWLKIRNRIDEQRTILKPQHLFGSDVNRIAVRAAKINLKAAGFKDVEIIQSDFRDLNPVVQPDLVITNPPHGRRLEEENGLRSLYRELGKFMKEKCTRPARGYIFTGNSELAKEIGLAAKRRYILNNGGIDSRLLEFDLY